jgi:6-phosphogluconolactonase (cycloisomerase 2 family)
MKFRKFGKALLTGALSVGTVLSVTSCVQSYTVGFLYVTGTVTSGTVGQGIVSGFKIDHNTGYLTPINGMPIASGGSNPDRAILLAGSRFLYVLNKGTDAAGGSDCTSLTSPCKGSSITQFSVGGNGALAQQETFFTQGSNPFRMFADSSGAYLYVLEHDTPSSIGCTLALGPSFTTCGDITAFKIDPTTGRLSVILNSQVTSASGQPLPYFPVPPDPIDMVLSGNFVLTMSGTPANGDVVFPYSYSPANGQLTISQNGVQPLNITQATAIQYAGTDLYVLDNQPITVNGITSSSQILPFTVGAGGSLQQQTGGPVADDPTLSNPLFAVQESKGKWVYVANTGDNSSKTNAQSGIAGYVIDPQTKQLITMSGSPFGTGAGPQCLVEDPSNQFFYTANFNSSSVTGVSVDQNSGVLRPLPGKANMAFQLSGPATYCLVNGRTS